MTHTPHELAADFPEHALRIETLKMTNAHFARLVDEYHAINRQVHRAESDVEPMGESAETLLRKRRMVLKDQLYAMLAAGN